MNIFKKTSVAILTVFIVACTLIQPQTVSAAEGGVSLGSTGMFGRDLINSAGIAGTTNYAKDGMSFNFRYITNFTMSFRNIQVVYNISVDPTLAPYVERISINGLGSRRGKYDVNATLPGEFYFMLKDTLIRTVSAVDITVHLNKDYRTLPKSKYAYSICMLDPNLGMQYILKTRATGVVETKPTSFELGSNLFSNLANSNNPTNHSYMGFSEGTVVEDDKLVDIDYEVYQKCYSFIRRNNLVFCFDTALSKFIDRIDVYNGRTGKFVQALSMTNSGTVAIPVSKIDNRLSLSRFESYWPVNLKVHFKNNMTFADITPGTYSISAYAESSPLLNLFRTQILKSSLCTMGIYKANNDEIKIPDLSDILDILDITQLPEGLLGN